VRALELLRRGAGRADAEFRAGQEDAIRHIVDGKGRLLVVQKTGWGKSFVYFIATRLLREQGAGPALLISPLLALMRNQICPLSPARGGRRRAGCPGTVCRATSQPVPGPGQVVRFAFGVMPDGAGSCAEASTGTLISPTSWSVPACEWSSIGRRNLRRPG
jgi:hypothetical protein